MGTRPEVHREFPGTGVHKEPDPDAFEAWVRQASRRKVQGDSPAHDFQSQHVGKEELLVRGGGEEVWADGYRTTDAVLREVKHVDKPESSPFIEGSRCAAVIREKIRKKELDQFTRYAAVLKDPATPAVELEVLLNDARAVPFFESLMRELGIPGRIVVISEGGP